MTRYAIDAPTLLHLVDGGRRADPSHQLVAPNTIRSDALNLLLLEVRAGNREERDALKAHTLLTEVKVRLLGDRVSPLAPRRSWPSRPSTRCSRRRRCDSDRHSLAMAIGNAVILAGSIISR